MPRNIQSVTTDPAAAAVLAAFEAATHAKLPTKECYLAGIRAWRSLHPEHKSSDAAQLAVGLILKTHISWHLAVWRMAED